ncbi:MAG: hypothetical protein LBG61_00160 [Burkholderiales bacterium]|jgi:hypothetical protein|nr:hypothetical protein [Burkholderiales bacterium]
MIENSVTIDKDLRTKTVALELFNAILEHKAPTKMVAMSDEDFLKLYRRCFLLLSALETPVKRSAIPSADKDADE